MEHSTASSPRDLFDVRDLLANEGLTVEVRIAFLIYLASHDRPMAEVIAPPRKNLAEIYERNFAGMTEVDVPLAELVETRERLIAELIGNMPEAHAPFSSGLRKEIQTGILSAYPTRQTCLLSAGVKLISTI